jgi:RNA polymerase sigma-70 factor (ECF subfamily)
MCNRLGNAASIVHPVSYKASRPPHRHGGDGRTDDEEGRMTAIRGALTRPLKAVSAARARPEPKARPTPGRGPGGGQVGEFAELYQEHFSRVFAYVYGRVQEKEASLDITSDVFEKAFVNKKSLRSPEAFGPWLFTIARNEVSSHWRKSKPAAKAIQDAAWQDEIRSRPRSPEETFLQKERVGDLATLIRTLPRREQEIISLKFDAELTNREIAQVLKTSEVNVRVTVFRALRKLRDRMKAAAGSGA